MRHRDVVSSQGHMVGNDKVGFKFRSVIPNLIFFLPREIIEMYFYRGDKIKELLCYSHNKC